LVDDVTEERVLGEERDDLSESLDDELTSIARDAVADVGDTDQLDVDEDELETILLGEAFPELGSVDQQAIKLGEGDGAERVRETVKEELEAPDETPYEDEEVWKEHVASVVKYELMEALDEGVLDQIDEDDIEKINEVIREELEERSEEIIRERLEEQKERVEELEEEWLRNEDGEFTPNRVPSGLPITPVPGYWIATANVWDVEVEGEYARFELRASSGTPSSVGGTTYVRDGESVKLENTDGHTHTVGTSEPITFSSRTMVLVVVPPGGVGVGDRTEERTECSETWPDVGHGPYNPDC